MAYKHQLSKSRYLAGKQCLKKLYLSKFHRKLATKPDAQQEALFSQGNEVGEWAQKRYPHGKDASPENYWDYSNSIKQTAEWIAAGEAVIYEASFFHEEVLAALDIFLQQDGKRIAIEVKSSTSVKDYHLDDAALQYWVMSQSGYTPDAFYIMHVNNQYVKEGVIDPEQLFTLAEVTEEVVAKQAEVAASLSEMKSCLKQEAIPKISIGPHCADPFSCEFKEHCWQHMPKKSVFDLSRISKKAWDYVEKGQAAINDLVANDDFSVAQQLHIKGQQEGSSFIDKAAIQDFLSEWQFPLYFFDFETIGPAIPIYDGTSPYKQFAVQYSVHVLEEEGAELKHMEFLPSFEEDPREALILQMIEDLWEKGSIVTYNVGFEKGKTKQLAEDFPQHAQALLAINERMVDLIIPFRSSWYYVPAMEGSNSIKSVLPALCPNEAELDYKGLAVSNGGDATEFLKALANKRVDPSKLISLRNDLLAYCKLDTLAMLKIWEVLRKL